MAGSQSFGGGASGSWVVPPYGTLTVEVTGPGGPGDGISGSTLFRGTISTNSTVSTLGITADAGHLPTGSGSTAVGGSGGTATGGNTENTAGDPGGNASGQISGGALLTSGIGGAAPHGGAAAAGVTSQGGQPTSQNAGNSGNGPGGGGSGGARNTGGAFSWTNLAAPGGQGGSYAKSVYTYNVTSGFPAWGASLAYSVGNASLGGVPGGAAAGGDGAPGSITFTWTDPPAPTVTSVLANHGPVGGGVLVIITGTNLTGATSVTFGGSAATSVTPVNATTVTCVTPAHAAGFVNVAVTNPGGTGTGTNVYSYDAQGTFAVTDGADIAAFVGQLNVFGTLAASEGGDLAFFTDASTDEDDDVLGSFILGTFGGDTAEPAGALAATEDPDVATFVGDAAAFGTLAATEAADTVVVDVKVEWSLTLAASEGPDVASFTGSLNVFGRLDATEEPDVVVILETAEWVIVLAATEAPDVAAFTSESVSEGTLAASEAPDVAAMAGIVDWSLSLDATEAPDVVVFLETAEWVIVLDATEEPDTVEIVGGIVGSGEWHSSEAPDTASMSGRVYWGLVLDATEAPDVAHFDNAEYIILDATEEPDVAAFTVVGLRAPEIEYIHGMAHVEALTGRALGYTLNGRGIRPDLIGSTGQTVAGRTSEATLTGRETTLP